MVGAFFLNQRAFPTENSCERVSIRIRNVTDDHWVITRTARLRGQSARAHSPHSTIICGYVSPFNAVSKILVLARHADPTLWISLREIKADEIAIIYLLSVFLEARMLDKSKTFNHSGPLIFGIAMLMRRCQISPCLHHATPPLLHEHRNAPHFRPGIRFLRLSPSSYGTDRSFKFMG